MSTVSPLKNPVYFQPATLREALELKRHYGSEAAWLAGGTDLILMMNGGRVPSRRLIDITRIEELHKVPELNSSRVRIGGGVTFSTLAQLPVRSLSEASLSVGGPQIRNRATIGGNIGTASPAADGVTALLALDTSISYGNIDGTIFMPLEDFFLEYRKTKLNAGDIVEAVTIDLHWKTAWQKLGKRGAMNISVVCCAVGISPELTARFAFGSVGPYPMRTPQAAQFLTDAMAEAGTQFERMQPLKDSVIQETCRMAMSEVRPIDDFRGSAHYRRAMAGALLKKALRQLSLSL